MTKLASDRCRLGCLLIMLSIWLLLLAMLQSCTDAAPAALFTEVDPQVPLATSETSRLPALSAVATHQPEPDSRQSPTPPSHDARIDPTSGRDTESVGGEGAPTNGPQLATRLVIPTLGVDAPVVEVPIINGTWDVSKLENEVAHLGGTAQPGQNGNTVLSGHVTLRSGWGPFMHLERLQSGDTVIVYAGDENYTYRVVGTKHVLPDDVSVTYPTFAPTLTLITCTTWDADNPTYAERVAVLAELVNDATP